jgi:endo-1,4-beta-xylanase
MNIIKISASLLLAAAAFKAEAAEETTLKKVFGPDFLIGAAINENQFSGMDVAGANLVVRQFNCITPENVMKWEVIHPAKDSFNFSPADRYVDFGEKNHLKIIGHTLVWHNQTPAWVFQDADGKPLSREALLERMREHIHTVVGRYKGRIKGWDVVNEALNEDGSLRQSQWMKIIGEDYIEKAFQFAHEADPSAELHYNDYSLENEPKRKGAIALITKLKAKGVPVTAIGSQDHIKLDWPSPELLDATLTDFSKLGVKVMITELDVDLLPSKKKNQTADVTFHEQAQAELNPYAGSLSAEMQKTLAKRYGEVFAVYLKHRDIISRVTFWGVSDGDSWLNDWPIKGRSSYPLLFGRDHKPKPAFSYVVAAEHSRQP